MNGSLRQYICDYFDMKPLKSGERGTVYAAQHRITKKRYIYREFFGSGEVYQKMRKLDCPHLPKIEAVEEEDGRTYVLEEFIQGDSLAFILRDGCILEAQAANIIEQLCAALDALHSLEIVHRDIKPENIILRGSDVVLIDFDASRVNRMERSTDTQVMGTAGYAAPEQYGFAQTDARADIYALGVLLNEMLVRQHPSRQLSDGRYQPVISRCIEVNVDKRYPGTEALLEALSLVGDPPEEKKRGKKRYALIAALVILLVVVGFAVRGMLVANRDPASEQNREQASDQSQNQTSEPSQEQVPGQTQEQIPEQNQDPVPEQTQNGPPESFAWEDIDFDLHRLGHRMPFLYDLDGDGQNEEYLFGVAFYNTLQDMVLEADVFGVMENHTHKRAPFPCVWKHSEEGGWIIAVEFAELLENPETRLEFLSDWENEYPAVDSLDAEWRGGMEVFFTREHIGTWLYTVSARLDGKELTASLTSSLYICNETEES